MALSNRERQARYRERLKAAARGEGSPSLLELLTAYFLEQPERLRAWAFDAGETPEAAATFIQGEAVREFGEIERITEEDASPAAVALHAFAARITAGWVPPPPKRARSRKTRP